MPLRRSWREEAEAAATEAASVLVAEIPRASRDVDDRPDGDAALHHDDRRHRRHLRPRADPRREIQDGQPRHETGRKPDEGPVHEVEIAPFWMGKHEVTWDEFELFMYPEEEKKTRARSSSIPRSMRSPMPPPARRSRMWR